MLDGVRIFCKTQVENLSIRHLASKGQDADRRENARFVANHNHLLALQLQVNEVVVAILYAAVSTE
jgi:hypothetical protein